MNKRKPRVIPTVKPTDRVNLNEELYLSKPSSDGRDVLINVLMSTIKVMEEMWDYHPSNPNKIDIISEYSKLEIIREDLEKYLDAMDI
jgi:hypothetical protein